MRVFVGCLATETNTFSPLQTGLEAFEELGIRRGAASSANPASIGLMLDAIHELARQVGVEVIEGLCACAQPLGPVVRAAYESLRNELLADLRAACPVDAVQLLLHGAMVADGYEDCEGDILARVRAIVGPGTAIGVVLDPHCHLTRAMLDVADIAVAFREYPHTDTAARAADVFRLTIECARGRIKPVTAVAECRMVGLWPTKDEPAAGFVRRLAKLSEQPGVLAASFAHGFPWGDVPEAGAKCWVTTDGDEPLAKRAVAALAREAWDLRLASVKPGSSIDEMLARMREPGRQGILIVADAADNPGGGAPGDHTGVLRGLIDGGVSQIAIGVLWDPGAVAACFKAGRGAKLMLSIGGKTGAQSGMPVQLAVTVRATAADHSQNSFGTRASFGPSAWVETDHGVHVVVSTLRQQVLHPDAFTGMGLDLRQVNALVVKSAQHFRAGFAAIAAEELWVESGGTLSHDFAHLPYRRRNLNYWPRVADPREPRAYEA